MARSYISSSGAAINESGSYSYVDHTGSAVQDSAVATGTPVSSDLVGSYGVLAYVTANLSATYTVNSSATTVSKDVVISYDVLMTVESDLASVSIIVAGGGLATFLSDRWDNNAGSSLAGASVVWSWLEAGRIGSLAPITSIDGVGVLDGNAQLLATGIPAGAGMLLGSILGATPADDYVMCQFGVAA